MLGGLTACGGGLSGASGDASPGMSNQAAVVSLSVGCRASPWMPCPRWTPLKPAPSFHAAPVLLDDPRADADAPTETRLSAAEVALPTRQRPTACDATRPRAGGQRRPGPAMASSTTVVTYIAGPNPLGLQAAQHRQRHHKARNSARADHLHRQRQARPQHRGQAGRVQQQFSLPSCGNRTLTRHHGPAVDGAATAVSWSSPTAPAAPLSKTRRLPPYDSGLGDRDCAGRAVAHAIAPLAPGADRGAGRICEQSGRRHPPGHAHGPGRGVHELCAPTGAVGSPAWRTVLPPRA